MKLQKHHRTRPSLPSQVIFIPLSAENKYKTFLEHIWLSDKDLLQSSFAHQKKVSLYFSNFSCSLELGFCFFFPKTKVECV